MTEDISKSIWRNHIKKYEDKFILFLGEDNIWKIKCKYGHIEPFDLKKGLLSFYGSFPSPFKKTSFLKKIHSRRINTNANQIGYDDCVVSFPETDIGELIKPMKIFKKRIITDEAREKMRQRAMVSKMWTARIRVRGVAK
jgi:hypothetical protein